jgi:hypothetical protein
LEDAKAEKAAMHTRLKAIKRSNTNKFDVDSGN